MGRQELLGSVTSVPLVLCGVLVLCALPPQRHASALNIVLIGKCRTRERHYVCHPRGRRIGRKGRESPPEGSPSPGIIPGCAAGRPSHPDPEAGPIRPRMIDKSTGTTGYLKLSPPAPGSVIPKLTGGYSRGKPSRPLRSPPSCRSDGNEDVPAPRRGWPRGLINDLNRRAS